MKDQKKLKKIPDHFVNTINRTAEVDTTKYQYPLEAIMAERARMKQPMGIENSVPAVHTVEVDGFRLPADPMTMWMYIMATVLGNDPRVQDILKQFNFTFHDLDNKPIYPLQKRKSTKRKKK